jgi:HK97 family phage major capsid protein
MARFTKEIEKSKRSKWDLVQKSRDLIARAEKEDRSMTTEERSEFDAMNSKIDDHEKRIADMEKLEAEEEPAEGDAGSDPEDVGDASRSGRPPLETRSGRPDARPHARPAYRDAYHNFLLHGERRDLSVGTNANGGYLLAPVQVSDDIVKQVDDMVFIRKLAKIYKMTNAVATGVRQRTARVSDADWTTEVGGPDTADSSMAFARRDLTPQLLAKLVKASIKLVESGPDAESIVNEDLAYKFAVAQEKAYMTGDGSGKPLGVFTASASGVPTSRDVTGTTLSDFNGDDVIAMKYSLKQGYVTDKTAYWIMHRTIVQKVRQFKDSQGRYLWQPGLAADRPDTLLDLPVGMSEYAPNTVSAGSYVAVLGAFRFYAIAQLRDLWIQRLSELYAETSEVGFIGRGYFDGSPVLAEAFSRLKCGPAS